MPSEIELITKGLDIGVDRLKQLDTIKAEQELMTILKAQRKTKTMLLHAIDLAERNASVALGATERAVSLNNLGRVQYLLGKYDQAHTAWLRALEHATLCYNLYGDNELLHLVTCNLMLTYIILKEYSNIERTLKEVENALLERPESLGGLHYIRMKVNEDRGNLEIAREHAYQSLQYLEQTFDEEQICRAMVNVAHYEYLLKNYEKSAEILCSAMEKHEISHYTNIFIAKEYVKSLIKLKHFEVAKQVLNEYLTRSKEYSDLHAKLSIFSSVVHNTPSYAEGVLKDTTINIEIRHKACAFLMSYYSYQDDSDLLMKYYKMGRMLSASKLVYFDEGDM
ncbi:hypothetical protein CBW65_04985 [Tumebacillus avium]|uniref:MalT-like TPR region domain-containing protein n=1 Tax=Tumebacillus avium TaxID=1903704 RepID=A0A1Y0IJN9_9BACL|nr:hypothetical protein CBW65_04985 [Tumebacillus avium]